MRKTSLIFFVSILLISKSLLSNTYHNLESNLEFGVEYLDEDCHSFPPPINDLCSGAIDLGELYCGYTSGFLIADSEATPDPEATGNCVDVLDPGEWYTFTTPNPLPFNRFYFNCGPFDGIEIFSSTSGCSGLVYVDCASNGQGFVVEPGTQYYLLFSGGVTCVAVSNSIEGTCDDPDNLSITEGGAVGTGDTSCALPSSSVPCENDHVIWFEYSTGCSESDILITVNDNTIFFPANEISISVFLDDCTTLMSNYDVNGLGYVCSGMGGGESLSLEDVPAGMNFMIAFGSAGNNIGTFLIDIVNTGEILVNDVCTSAEVLIEGTNMNLTNECASLSDPPNDAVISDCTTQSESTVWYSFHLDGGPKDITVNLLPTGISSPALAAYVGCGWGSSFLASTCDDTSLELFCVNSIKIEVGSSHEDEGTFDLEIISSPSSQAYVPTITADDICSHEAADIDISIPGGELVNITVDIAFGGSSSITGMTSQTFLGVNTATINDILVNSSSIPQEATYVISVFSIPDNCPSLPVEYTIIVNPEFNVNPLTIESCAPYSLEINASELIGGGSLPYASTSWYWNSTDLLSTDNVLSIDLEEPGEITLEVIDAAGCTQSAVINAEISIPIVPMFDFPLVYCRSEQDFIYFVTTSLEGIEGIWNIPFIDLEQYEDGFYDIEFTPDEPQCSLPAYLTIEILSGDMLEFNLPNLICASESEYIFPTMDLNGIPGNWTIPSVDQSSSSGELTNTFIPNSMNCYAAFEHEFEIQDNIELTFGIPDSFCKTDEPYILNNISEEGFEGTWDISTLDPSLVSDNIFSSTWTPLAGQSPCINDTTITVEIIDPLLPQFSLPDELCKLDMTFIFPLEDDQLINGTWSIPTIDPSSDSGIIQSIFTSEDDCVETFIWEIEIVESLIPEFNLEQELCSLDDLYTLPLISDNGISGSWTQSTIDPSTMAGEEIMVEFYGDTSEFCIESIEVLFEVNEAQDPVFNLPVMFCWTDEDVQLPTISDNSVEGLWTPPIIDVQSNPGAMISSTFTPTDGSCTNEALLSFEILSPFEVDAIVTDPSDCSVEDGSVSLDIIQGDNLEYSIDGGNTWQSSTLFSSLGSGGYTILIRSVDLIGCEQSIKAFLTSPDGPVINGIASINISSCILENGSITVDADGYDLEYSIDNGMTWQTSNAFDNLPEGDYEITIRESMSDCTVEVSASISDFPETVILDVNAQNISDCNTNDGQIEILAEGESLEYSIDNGATWSTENTFDNLSDGQFVIIVQSTLGDDCTETIVVELESPDAPSIINIDALSPSECSPNMGRIDIDAEGNNLEYSIDGGVTWFSAKTFSDLESGMYLVMVRDSEKTNCFDEVSVELMLEDENLAESTFMITPPSECELADAAVEVINALQDVEYSIDGGLIWQSSKLFENLPAGSYTIISRMISLPECSVEQDVEIPNSECPCNDLMLDFMISNVSCLTAESARVDLVSVQGMYNPDVDILWSTGEMGNSIEGVEEGWQIVTIAYDDHCVWVDSVWVDLINPIQFDWNIEDLGCPESDDGSIEIIDVTGGSGNYEYSIDGINYVSDNKFTDLPEGEYDLYVRDNGDCLSEAKVELTAQDRVDIILNEVETIFIGESIVLDPGINETEIDSFAWISVDDISNKDELIIEVSPKITTSYTLEIYYRGCFTSKEVLVQVKLEEEIFVGNVFSPNGDNQNDFLFIQGKPNSTIQPLDFNVFDRWGNRIFNIEGPEFNIQTDGWDGHYQGQLAIPGVYVYMINYIQHGEEKMKVGTVTLIH